MVKYVKESRVGARRAVAVAAVAAGLFAVGACGSYGATGQQPTDALPTASACPQAAAATPPLRGVMQALTVIDIHVTAGVATTPGVLHLGPITCVSVGVGQAVALAIDARMPPIPAEQQGTHLLSAIAVTPPVASGAGVRGHYTVSFSAQQPGTTTLAYLPATCTLPPGAC
jgi:hypothetical protein